MEPLWASLTMTVAGIFSSFSKILLKKWTLKKSIQKSGNFDHLFVFIKFIFLIFYFELGFSRPPNGLVLALHC